MVSGYYFKVLVCENETLSICDDTIFFQTPGKLIDAILLEIYLLDYAFWKKWNLENPLECEGTASGEPFIDPVPYENEERDLGVLINKCANPGEVCTLLMGRSFKHILDEDVDEPIIRVAYCYKKDGL